MAPITQTKKGPASRVPKHKKKYWRKGTNVEDIETSMTEIAAEKQIFGVPIHELADEDLFTLDREPVKVPKTYTKKQQAVLDKITRSISDAEPVSLPEPKAPKGKLEKLRKPVTRVEKKTKKHNNEFDLWGKEFEPKVDLKFKEAGEHLLKYTKKKLIKRPKTALQKSSLLPAVTLPAAGASYNPDVVDYEEYVSKIVKDELKVIKKEEAIERASRPQYEKVVTHGERYMEEIEGLPIDPRTKEVEADSHIEMDGGDEDDDVPVKIAELKQKTKKQKEKLARIAKEEKAQKKKKELAKKQHEVFKAKKINSVLAKEESANKVKSAERRKKKIIDKLTKPGRLGRGKFEEEEDPFLLKEELVSNLRTLKPQGSIMEDRLKSIQKRNILPISGAKNKHKLKTKLKRKLLEKRNVKEVTKGSRVI